MQGSTEPIPCFAFQILARVRYGRDDSRGRAGINQLLKKGVYEDAFPLHDGDYDYGDEETNATFMNHRRVRVSGLPHLLSHLDCFDNFPLFYEKILYLEWAKWKNWYRKQPLWLIKKYFGVKLGLYFAWMGLYTQVK